MKRRTIAAGTLALLALLASSAGAGRLETESATDAPNIVAGEHAVRVVIQNGFAMTEVRHTFRNRGDRDLEATYSFPLPKSASLSELTIISGEREIHGEVLPAREARRIYEEERDQGRDAGLAEKNGYQDFRFSVSPVRARRETTIRFVYYQPLEIDTGVGRYLYPLEDGGTDEGASFWKPGAEVEGGLCFEIELKSAHPVAEVRLPGHETEARIDRLGPGHLKAVLERRPATLARDIVFYYRLEEGLPGRVDLIPYREAPDKPGTFMLVVTPGLDLKPITGGADFTFVLDVSGSMEGKIETLARGVSRSLGELTPDDRFRLVAFCGTAGYLTRGLLPATPENVKRGISLVEGLTADGSTNLFDGLRLGLADISEDRAHSVVLVTDAVTNTGVVDPAAFDELMRRVDVRTFGFLMGNNANWPLMQAICEASGGFWAQVSNMDDILGQLLLAKSKITHECLHDASLKIDGVDVLDVTDAAVGKVFRGQQLVFFGRYTRAGKATVTLEARLTGEDKIYRTTFDFPEVDTENPEIERLWALHRIEAIEAEELLGKHSESEADQAVRDLGVAYQLVTDETAMVVLSDEVFTGRGIERRNLARVAKEHEAQAMRATRPAQSRRVDTGTPMFKRRAPGIGGGALDPWTVGLAIGLAALGLGARRGKRR